MWSIERVGVLYKLKTIGNRDWYQWGLDILLPNQNPNGCWTIGGYGGGGPTVDTCFALLFLRRSNLVQDLTESLPRLDIGIIDPDKK